MPRGFSLIELMIVISIISILAMLALPSYQHYIQRARFAEVISSTEIYKTAIALALQTGASVTDIMLGKNGIPDEPKPTKHLANLRIEEASIIATGTALVNSLTYVLKPNRDGTQWNIGGTCFKAGMCSA